MAMKGPESSQHMMSGPPPTKFAFTSMKGEVRSLILATRGQVEMPDFAQDAP